jgi:hypothetical protein
MREYRGPDGDHRIWYEPEEIEAIFEGELRRSKLMPSLSNPVTDVERFIESHLHVALDQYAELPQDTLGLTSFANPAHPWISINATLTEEAESSPVGSGVRGRWRATLAHEAAHVVLHRGLFDPQLALLQHPLAATTTTSASLFRCSATDVTAVVDSELARRKGSYDWREVQANKGMAALLMPRPIFRRVLLLAQSELGSAQLLPGEIDNEALIGRLATTCEVSRQSASIRVQTISERV